MTTKAIQLLTNSRLKDARACQRLHRYRFLDMVRALQTASALRFGTLLHLCLEAWWKAPFRDDDARMAAVTAVVEASDADAFDKVRALELMRGYTIRWGAEPYRAVAVESEFECALVNPLTGRESRTWRLAGKLDVVVEHIETLDKFLMEHKSSSEDITPGSEYWRRLTLDGQVSMYYEGARSLGHDVQGCIYDVIGKPGLKPLKATPVESRKYTKDGRLYAAQRLEDETPEEFRVRLVEDIAADPAGYFQRGSVVRLESEMIDALYDIWQLGQQIAEAENVGRYPRNPDACVRYGRTCEYFGVCTGEVSLEDPTQFVQLTTPFPELSGQTTPQAKEVPNGSTENSSPATAATT